MTDQQPQVLSIADAQAYLQKWQGDAFQNLLDSFHMVNKNSEGFITHHRVHTYFLDGIAATKLFSNPNTKSLRVHLSISPETNKFVFLLQGENNGSFTDYYVSEVIEQELAEDTILGSPINPKDTIIPFSLAKLYADQWNRCAPNDLIGAFHAPIDIPVFVDKKQQPKSHKDKVQKTIKESQRVRYYTYSSDDTASLQDIITKNSNTLKVDRVFIYLGSGDPNPEYGHPFSFRPILRLVMKSLHSGTKVNIKDLNIPPQTKFTNLEGGEGGSTTVEFAQPCPPTCGSGGGG